MADASEQAFGEVLEREAGLAPQALNGLAGASASRPPRPAASRSPRQGFAERGRAPPARARCARVVDRLGARPDRLGQRARSARTTCPPSAGSAPTRPTLLDRLAHYAPRRLFEYWGHEASLLPVELQPLLRWRMDRAARRRRGAACGASPQERPELVAARARATSATRGPARPRASSATATSRAARKGPWWDWSDVKRALEFLFWSGRDHERAAARLRAPLRPARARAARRRRSPRRRRRSTTAQRELLRVAARVARRRDRARPARLLPAAGGRGASRASPSWSRPASCCRSPSRAGARPRTWRRGARVPRRVDARALVGPFDSLIWERPRVERLFGFRYRIEIYVPKPQARARLLRAAVPARRRLVARVDLKADRQAGALLVQAAHAEAGAPPETAEALRRASSSGWRAGSGSTRAG